MRIRFFIILLICYLSGAEAQIRFTPALVYQNIAEKGYTTQEVVTRLANYYYALHLYSQAQTWYEKLVTTVGYMPTAIDYYHYAHTLKELGKNKEAQKQMERFTSVSRLFFTDFIKTAVAPPNPNNRDYKELIGLVLDGENGKEIEGAAITLFDAQMYVFLTTMSDSNSFFVLSDKQSQALFEYGYLEVVKPEYEVSTTPLVFQKTGEMQQIIQLDPLVQEVNTGDNLAITFEIENIHFDYGRINIRYDASVQLAKILVFLEMNPMVSLDIKVHTDSRGDEDYNMKLSESQAQSIWQWLVDKGIQTKRITAKGYGETQPVYDCENDSSCTEEQHQANKRVEFIIK